MLSIGENGCIQVDIEHLQAAVPITLESVIERYEKLQIRLFFHVVSSPDCRYEKRFGKGRVPKSIRCLPAKDRLKRILKEQQICGNPKGYFVNKHLESLTASQLEEIKSVSFTLCDTEKLAAHFDARKSSYAICFFHDFLEAAGLRPVVYLNGRGVGQQRQLVFTAPHLLEMQSPKYDMRWENEFRIKGKLKFDEDDIAFLVVPDGDYASFGAWAEEQHFGYPVLPASAFTDPLAYLRMVPLVERCWYGQMKFMDDRKFIVNFDEFQDYTEDDKRQMLEKAGEYLKVLGKVAVHEEYEHRFVERFLAFVGKLNESAKALALVRMHPKLEKNAREPWRSRAALVRAAYWELFQIQADRITKHWRIDEDEEFEP